MLKSELFQQVFGFNKDEKIIPPIQPAGIQMDFIKEINDDHILNQTKQHKHLPIQINQQESMEISHNLNLESKNNKNVQFEHKDHFQSLFVPAKVFVMDLTNDHLAAQQKIRTKFVLSLAIQDIKNKEISKLCKE